MNPWCLPFVALKVKPTVMGFKTVPFALSRIYRLRSEKRNKALPRNDLHSRDCAIAQWPNRNAGIKGKPFVAWSWQRKGCLPRVWKCTESSSISESFQTNFLLRNTFNCLASSNVANVLSDWTTKSPKIDSRQLTSLSPFDERGDTFGSLSKQQQRASHIAALETLKR